VSDKIQRTVGERRIGPHGVVDGSVSCRDIIFLLSLCLRSIHTYLGDRGTALGRPTAREALINRPRWPRCYPSMA
jgi:hypothetical protein